MSKVHSVLFTLHGIEEVEVEWLALDVVGEDHWFSSVDGDAILVCEVPESGEAWFWFLSCGFIQKVVERFGRGIVLVELIAGDDLLQSRFSIRQLGHRRKEMHHFEFIYIVEDSIEHIVLFTSPGASSDIVF